MNWDAIGSIGDAIGGIGVIASLIYLALQTRQNTRAVRAASFHQVADSFSAVSLAVLQDPTLVSLVLRAQESPDSLTPEETARFGFFLLTFLRRAESMYYQSREGLLGRETWSGIREATARILGSRPAQLWWPTRSGSFSPEFRKYVEDELIPRKSPSA